jgi:hypothetical protein
MSFFVSCHIPEKTITVTHPQGVKGERHLRLRQGHSSRYYFRELMFTWGKGFHVQFSLLEWDTVRQSWAFLILSCCGSPGPNPTTSSILTAHAITPMCSHACGQHH